jgi:hypothetical protein
VTPIYVDDHVYYVGWISEVDRRSVGVVKAITNRTGYVLFPESDHQFALPLDRLIHARALPGYRISDQEAAILRRHLRDSHRNLFEAVLAGPLADVDLETLDPTVMRAIHTANHFGTWRDHESDRLVGVSREVDPKASKREGEAAEAKIKGNLGRMR